MKNTFGILYWLWGRAAIKHFCRYDCNTIKTSLLVPENDKFLFKKKIPLQRSCTFKYTAVLAVIGLEEFLMVGDLRSVSFFAVLNNLSIKKPFHVQTNGFSQDYVPAVGELKRFLIGGCLELSRALHKNSQLPIKISSNSPTATTVAFQVEVTSP